MADTIIVKDDEKPEEVEVKEEPIAPVAEIAEVAKEQASETIALAAQIAGMMDSARASAEETSAAFVSLYTRLDKIDSMHDEILNRLNQLLIIEKEEEEEIVIKSEPEIEVLEKKPEEIEEVVEVKEEPQKRTNKKRRFI